MNETPEKIYHYNKFYTYIFLIILAVGLISFVLSGFDFSSNAWFWIIIGTILYLSCGRLKVLTIFSDYFIIKIAPASGAKFIKKADVRSVDVTPKKIIISVIDKTKPVKLPLSCISENQRGEVASYFRKLMKEQSSGGERN